MFQCCFDFNLTFRQRSEDMTVSFSNLLSQLIFSGSFKKLFSPITSALSPSSARIHTPGTHGRALLPCVSKLLLCSCLLISVPAARAEDWLTLDNNRKFGGEALEVVDSKVRFLFGKGEISVPLQQIVSLKKPAPEQFEEAEKLFREEKYNLALTKYQTLVDQFFGLPVEWVQIAANRLGELYIKQEKYSEAEAIYKRYDKLYTANQDLSQSQLIRAQIALAQNHADTAKNILEPLLEIASSKEYVTDQEALLYGKAFLMHGQIKEIENEYPEALENYLKVVTLYPYDQATRSEAQEKARKLREQHRITVP